MLCGIRNAPDCSVPVSPVSILTSTDRTATVAFPRLRRPRGVSRVQHLLHGCAEGARRLFHQVAQRRLQVDAGAVLTHVRILT
jgi:hypothetical protein